MLHIINKSPQERNSLESCLRVAQDGGTLLLIEDAVYAATRGNAAAAKLREAQSRFKVCVLQADLEARGMADHLIDGVTTVDYGGFVDLAAQHKNCQSWL
ncbi:MAG: sulfurtransferase complex subunit TusB [Betaproteobacteria bacterium]|nr:sulfurtransferase complex subunit TusB [Betaproteobacteria bacterium]